MRIKLNNYDYRYEVFQIVNLFFPWETEFVDDDGDLLIAIESNTLNISYNEKTIHKYFENNFPIKEQIKKELYLFLYEVTGVSFPWGILVGIRPTKIAHMLLEEGLSQSEVVKYYKEHYLTQENKARLCLEVAKAEKRFIYSDPRKISIYIGMPFCPTRCVYCSFTSNPINSCKNLVEPYLEALRKEIEFAGEYILNHGLDVDSIYFGGGTPTSISDEQFERLMATIDINILQKLKVKEYTVECGRPDSITANKLFSMKEHGVNRISINPQTMNDSTLKAIGRLHSAKEVITTYEQARAIGFESINMDLILGLPGEGLQEVIKTLKEIEKLAPDNITIHGLSIKRASKLHEQVSSVEKHKLDEIISYYNETEKLAERLGLIPYYMYRQKNMVGNMENVGYAYPGKECLYNILMIEENQSVMALGADAISKAVYIKENRIERYRNIKDVKEYINRLNTQLQEKAIFFDKLYL